MVKMMYPACKGVQDLVAVDDIVHNRPQAEFDRFYAEKFHTRKDCIFLSRGEAVEVDAPTNAGRLCVRKRDVAECYWTDAAAFMAPL